MKIKQFLPSLIISVLLIACGGNLPASATQAPTSLARSTQVPTAVVATTQVPNAIPSPTQPPTTVPPSVPPMTVTPTQLLPTASATTKQFSGLESGLDDAEQARLNLAHFVANGPRVDLLLNGMVAVNGGQPQLNIPAGYATGFMYLEPGSYSVSVVPTGAGLNQAIVGPLDVTLSAGHRYTVALIGQLADHSVKPLVIDQTALVAKQRTAPNQNIMLMVNNIQGTKTMDWGFQGEPPTTIPYGGAAAGQRHVGRGKGFVIYADGDVKNYLDGDADSLDSTETPGIDQLYGTWGNFSNGHARNLGGGDGAPMSDLRLLDFLKLFDGTALGNDGQPLTFNTFLNAVKTAGLTDELTQGPHLVLAPTDAAFAAMPRADRDRILSDPKALADLLKNHIIAGFVPRGSLAKTPGGSFNRTFTNLLGHQITIGDGFTVNGRETGDFDSYFVANGTQVHPLAYILAPSK